jgi:phage terminase large subunit-like protein
MRRPLPPSPKPPARCTADWLLSLSESKRQALLQRLTATEKAALNWDWTFWARPNQLAPTGEWRVWLLMAGRGFGKTRCGAEWIRAEVESGRRGRLALVAETAADARDVMVEGESGLLAVSPPWFRPRYEPSKRRVTWPNGAIATTYSADDPEQLRGPQHDGAWCDEIGKWRYGQRAWDNLMFGLRLGNDPRCVATTTPRAVELIRHLLTLKTTVTTRGTTYENRVHLAPGFFTDIVSKYEGTRLGRQELLAEMLEDNPDALWQRAQIEELRVLKAPELVRIVVAIDPPATSGEEAAEAGIVAAGLGKDGHGYVLADASLRATPDGWARAAVTLYHALRADRIVAEANNGGEMVEHTIRTLDKTISCKSVHASRGKLTRAEPVSALYEQKKVHHVGSFPVLEDQMCQWMPGERSPDRLDALVWALTDLMIKPSHAALTANMIKVGK